MILNDSKQINSVACDKRTEKMGPIPARWSAVKC